MSLDDKTGIDDPVKYFLRLVDALTIEAVNDARQKGVEMPTEKEVLESLKDRWNT